MDSDTRRGGYEPPAIHLIGPVTEVTQYCDKTLGSSDGFTFQGSPVVCAST